MNKHKNLTFYITFVGLLSFAIYLYAFSGGITGKTKKNGNGCTCHGSFSNNVNVVIDGPSEMAPGETKEFTVTITGGPLVAAGTNISASAGELIAGLGTQLLGNELTHTQPKSASGGKVIFPFSLTAPSVETEITLFANGNSVNLDGTSSGDSWNFAPNKIITVKNPTNVDDVNLPIDFSLSQNYPNPFNPTTQINYSIKEESFVELKIFDLLGNEIATLVNEQKPAGNYTIKFDALSHGNQISSGVYIYRLQASSFNQTKKMILLK